MAQMLDTDLSVIFIFAGTPSAIIEKFLGNRYGLIWLPTGTLDKEPELVIQAMIASGAYALVMDGYAFDYFYQKKVHSAGFKIVYIDDLILPRYCVDMLINQAAGVCPEHYANDCDGKFLLGPKYSLLRAEFLELARREARSIMTVKSVFVSFGGADPASLTDRTLNVLARIAEIGRVEVLMGRLNPQGEALALNYRNDKKVKFHFDQSAKQVATQLLRNDLAIISNSSISLEACAVGVPMITGIAAENQRHYAQSFCDNDLSIDIGDWRKSTSDDLLFAMQRAMEMPAWKRSQQLRNQKRYVDGFSDQRIKAGIATL